MSGETSGLDWLGRPRGGALHTADRGLLRTSFPTVSF